MLKKHPLSQVSSAIRAGLSLALLLSAVPALAGGGNVLPACARPKGYSLIEAAKATAVYNTGAHDAAPPRLPFYTLTEDAKLRQGTELYVPVYFADDSGDVVPPFPEDITDQDADADYLDGLIFDDFGVEAFIIVVDGKVTVLDDSYIHGTKTQPLQDGPPDGTHYIVCAAFLTPLTPGKHTIGIGGIIDGQPVVFVNNSVTVSH